MKFNDKDIMVFILSISLLTVGLIVKNVSMVYAISIIVGLLAVINKKAGLMTLITFIPFRPFLIELNPSLKSIGDIIILMIFIRTLFEQRTDIKRIFNFHIFEISFFVFGFIGVVSALIHGVDLKAIIVQGRAYFLFYLVFYVVKRLEITKKDIFKYSMITFVISTVLSFQGIIEKISNKTLLVPYAWEQWSLSPTNQIRVYGLLKGPNELALYLIFGFIISIYLAKSFQGKKRLVIYWGMVLMATTIILTYSRGAYLCLGAFVIVYFLFKASFKKVLPLLIISLLSLILFIGVTKTTDLYFNKYISGQEGLGEVNKSNEIEEDKNEQGIDRFKGAFSGETIEQSNTSGRIYYVKKALEVLKDYPIMGSGFATFGGSATLKYSSPIYKDYDIGYNFYSDNQYILILAETGIIGVIALIITLLCIAVLTWQKRRDYFYSPILVYFFVATVVGGVVYNILENDSFMLNYFIILGLAFHTHTKSPKGVQ